MPLITTLKYLLFGRESIADELSDARREAKRKSNRSFVSGAKGNIEYHHGFKLSEWPMFGAYAWNLWPMTKREHRTHARSYHSFAKRFERTFLGRKLIAGSPIGLYLWKYFYWHWWKGMALVTGAIWIAQWFEAFRPARIFFKQIFS